MILNNKEHTCIWVRWKKNFGEWQYKCDDPDCYKVKAKSFLIGKRTMCAVCRQRDFVLTKLDLKLARPRCEDCSTTKEALERKRIKSIAAKILDGTFEPPKPQTGDLG